MAKISLNNSPFWGGLFSNQIEQSLYWNLIEVLHDFILMFLILFYSHDLISIKVNRNFTFIVFYQSNETHTELYLLLKSSSKTSIYLTYEISRCFRSFPYIFIFFWRCAALGSLTFKGQKEQQLLKAFFWVHFYKKNFQLPTPSLKVVSQARQQISKWQPENCLTFTQYCIYLMTARNCIYLMTARNWLIFFSNFRIKWELNWVVNSTFS